jgi:glyoxylase-like metal-dependent hydrolase (beta-lactamase superfamily II)
MQRPPYPVGVTALLDVLTVGYVGDRVAGTVCLVRSGPAVIVVDPGMVSARSKILEPLAGLGIGVADVTDVVISHHHPDHTVNIALFPQARVHDFQATYLDDQWLDHDDDFELAPSVRLIATPGHTPQDLTTLVETTEGLAALTHLWWTADGPADDPFAADREQLAASRQRVVALDPWRIVPGHGPAFSPTGATPI